jgi:ADP-heptose:LPS heptosyltransferase
VRFLISTIGLNRREGTRQCIERVIKHGHDFHLVLTDNGSTDGTGQMFDEFAAKHSNITVVHNTTNQGFQDPHAHAFRLASQMGAEFFLCLNDDLLVEENFLDLLVEPMERDQTVAITGPTGGCESLNHLFHGEPSNGRPPDYCEGSLMLVRVSTIQRLRNNLWCPGLKGIYGEDSSLSLFVRERGYQIAKVKVNTQHARSSTVNSDPAIKAYCNECQEHNHRFNQHRWAYYLEHHRFDLPILIKRQYAIGDVVLITPIIRAIAQSRPLSPILVETDFPELLADHPQVYQAAKTITVPGPHLTIDLNGAYESTTQTHVVDAYWQKAAEVITGLEPVDHRTELFPSATDQRWAQRHIQGQTALLSVDSTTWPGKNWPTERMQQVAHYLTSKGWQVIAVGSKNRSVPTDWPKVVNLVGQTTLPQLASLCAQAQLVVTPDTSLLHLAQAVGCPAVSLFGVTRSRYLTTRGSRCVAVESDESLPNSGIRHRLTGVTHIKDGTETMESITVDQVTAAIEKIQI